MPDDVIFEVGGRYRNRLGWYEVLETKRNMLKIRYESDGREDHLEMVLLKRIIQNISAEEQRVTPYDNYIKNEKYFRTLGYLCGHGFIEAIIPYKSKAGFDNTFMRIKGRLPCQDENGYYIHNPAVDKWGVEMRLTFTKTETSILDFGGSYTIVNSPDQTKLRINSNELCYHLLQIGFNLGEQHDASKIRANIPERFKSAFEEGIR